ncbi:MAG: alpha/beta fold hydrolase [Candidatus Hydrogenedentes bacterium]|nr:alpha/beta fold hydrolase [Candidatus Hydrogenedentota bacterium]
MIRLSTTAVAFLLVTFVSYSHAGQPSPEARGPYPVGVTTIQLEDSSRIDPKLAGPRPLLAEIWYPANDSARDAKPTSFSDFYMDGKNIQMNMILALLFKFDIAVINTTFKTIAVRDADIAGGTFPLLIFSHGNGGMRSQSTFWCDHLASHGFIVAAVDHTRNACATSYKGQVIPYDNDGRAQAAIDRPKDLSFLIDTLIAMNGDTDSKFRGHVDADHIGVAGHSFGGFTAMAAAALDPRVDAIAPMAAVVPDFSKSSKRPLLLFIATEDDTIDEAGNTEARAYYEDTTSPKYLVEMKNAGHYSFSDMFQLNPAWGDGIGEGKRITDGEALRYLGMTDVYRFTNGYSTAFFHKYLKDSDTFEQYLKDNQAPKELIFRYRP